MPSFNYHWSLPYRPAGFFRSASLDFHASVEIDQDANDRWVERNRQIGNEQGFGGFYYRDELDLWVIESVEEEADVFDSLLTQMAEEIAGRIEDEDRMTQADAVNYLMAFVHQFPYSRDHRSTSISEYARFPIETLWDRTGDCECLALLLAALIHHAEAAPVALLRGDHHVAVGVRNSDDDGSMSGSFYRDDDGRKYYYCEATGRRRTVGEAGDNSRGMRCEVHPID